MVSELSEEEPYTDIEIADIVSEKLKIKVSRRAIAQYRKQLNIPSSLQRKKILGK